MTFIRKVYLNSVKITRRATTLKLNIERYLLFLIIIGISQSISFHFIFDNILLCYYCKNLKNSSLVHRKFPELSSKWYIQSSVEDLIWLYEYKWYKETSEGSLINDRLINVLDTAYGRSHSRNIYIYNLRVLWSSTRGSTFIQGWI